MSNSEQDPFDILINGETASAQQIEILERSALRLVETVPSETHQVIQFSNPKTGSTIELGTTVYEHIESENSFATIRIGDFDWLFSLTFNHLDEASTFSNPDLDDLSEAGKICADLIRTTSLDSNLKSILEYFYDHITILQHEDMVGKLHAMSKVGGTNEHIADAMRREVADKSSETAIVTREFEEELSDQTTLIIRTQLPIGYETNDPDLDHCVLLEILLYDQLSETTQRYAKTQLGSTFTISDGYENKEAFEVEPPEAAIFEDYIAVLHSNQIGTDEADNLIGKVSEAIELRENTDTQQNMSEDSNTFPNLDFHFNSVSFIDDDEISHELTTKAVLRTLHDVCDIELSQLRSDEYPEVFAYAFNENRQARINKFLQQYVTNTRGQRTSRVDVLDVHVLCDHILEELAQYNHPVFQAICQLENEYGDILGEVVIQHVITGVILQTQEKLVKNVYNQRVQSWRIGELALA